MSHGPLRRYLFGIKCRLRGENPVRRIAAWHWLWAQWWCKRGLDDGKIPDGMELDVVIPTVPKDRELLGETVAGIRRHLGHPVHKVFIVAPCSAGAEEFCRSHACEFVDERTLLGYGREAVPYVAQGVDRSGWLFQQLLKLAAGNLVERDNYLVADSDTVLIRRQVFADRGKNILLTSGEWHRPYFETFRRLFGYPAPGALSYTSHMMIFNREHLRAMQAELEQRHGRPWDQVYRECANPGETSCVSEYETYANWILHHHPGEVRNQALFNASLPRAQLRPLAELQQRHASQWKSLSFHSYLN